MFKAFDLQLFGDGDGGAGASGGPASGSGQAGVQGAQDAAAPQERAKKATGRDRYGSLPQPKPQQPPRQDAAVEATQQEQPKSGDDEFEELIKTKYSKQFEGRVQQIINARLKTAKQFEAEATNYRPVIQALAEQYNVSANDPQALLDKIVNNDEKLEEEALKMGVPIETVKEMRKLQSEAESLKREKARREQEEAAKRHYMQLHTQGEELKKKFPSFNLNKELENPEFRRVTGPDIGMGVEQAYIAMHYNEIQPQTMRFAAEKSAEKLARSVQSNNARPMENGTNPAPFKTVTDLKSMSYKNQKQEIERVKRLLNMGQRVIPG